MAKRFKNLKSALKLLRPLAGGDAPDLPDSSALGFFQAVVAGKKTVEYGDRPEGSEPQSLITYALTPFADPGTDAAKLLVSMSQRAESGLSTSGIAATDLFVSKTGTDIAAATDAQGFTPARVTVRVAGTADTTNTSKLTGRRYKTKGGASRTYPFGRNPSSSTEGYKDRKAAILGKVKTGTGGANRSASFTPEIYR
ncbi:MAG TPA: hypothetical protein VK203_28260 [Nostocaceae cyanobacterium]|nr:hypothetical protein [Nostocaceae cyanobacterium]